MENHAHAEGIYQPRLKGDGELTHAAAIPSAFHFSTSQPPFLAAPCDWPIRSRRSRPRVPAGPARPAGRVRPSAFVAGFDLSPESQPSTRPAGSGASSLLPIDCCRGILRARISDRPPTMRSGRSRRHSTKPRASLEESFAAVQNSQRQLETLLNSMQDAVIAVGAR